MVRLTLAGHPMIKSLGIPRVYCLISLAIYPKSARIFGMFQPFFQTLILGSSPQCSLKCIRVFQAFFNFSWETVPFFHFSHWIAVLPNVCSGSLSYHVPGIFCWSCSLKNEQSFSSIMFSPWLCRFLSKSWMSLSCPGMSKAKSKT